VLPAVLAGVQSELLVQVCEHHPMVSGTQAMVVQSASTKHGSPRTEAVVHSERQLA
jgi:hypothetical protein